jgi:CRP-like cAMP-binding protein
VTRTDARTEILRRTILFGALEPDAIGKLAAMAKPVSVACDEVIFRKGDDGRSLYVIELGRVKIAATSSQGQEVALNLLGPGDVFGEVALMDRGVRTADAIACEPVRLLSLDRADLVPFLERDTNLVFTMLATLAQRFRWVSGRYEDSVFLSVQARLAKRLLFLADHFGSDMAVGRRLTVSLPQRELAGHLGVTRETINRLIQEWRDAGLISVQRGVVVLLNRDRLAEIAGVD